ncbi:sugar phosphate isomerase/epimerase family protein [Shouchella patagoniensis]|uniref:sugar phosphate isomerase/epimerase family protein n=1 Tax=Shouchella patagoniensis TaxID=228576 RepID=UPI00099553D6|nr:sugar phosphate isomerase/epimerase family protein [Shouchella patagoniensis]
MNSQAEMNRLSLNQITTEQWSLAETIEGCARQNVAWISVWRHKLHEYGLNEAKKHIGDAGLRLSSLCRGGMFSASTKEERVRRIDDNKRAIDEASELGTNVLVLVCGPGADKDLLEARKHVQEGIEQLIPYAKEQGIKLGIEPLHPMYAADRSVINTLGQANDLVETVGKEQVGVVIDAFHVWWDPYLEMQIKRAAGNILGFHVSDWKIPITDMFKGRSLMGDGVIELKKMRRVVEANGYKGPIEVEIMNQILWDMQGDEALTKVIERYKSYV